MTINKKIHNKAHVHSDMIKRGDALFVVFSQNLNVSTFNFLIVAVRSFAADKSLQPTGGSALTFITSMSHAHCVFLRLPQHLHSLFLLHNLLSDTCSSFLPVNFIFQDVVENSPVQLSF